MFNITDTTTRKCLADVEPEELREWLIQRRKWLTDHKRFVQRYLDSRAHRRGKQTYTDRQYTAFQMLADDLLELIDSVVANIDQYAQEQRHVRSLEAELERLREAERRRLLDIEIRTRQAEARRLADAARHGEVAASIRLDQQPAQA